MLYIPLTCESGLVAGEGSDHVYGVVDDAGTGIYYDGVAVVVAGLIAVGDGWHLLKDGHGEGAELGLPAGREHAGAVVFFAQAGREVAGAVVVLRQVGGVLVAEEVVAVVAASVTVSIPLAMTITGPLVVAAAVALIVTPAVIASVALVIAVTVAMFAAVALGIGGGRGEEEGSEGERGEESGEAFVQGILWIDAAPVALVSPAVTDPFDDLSGNSRIRLRCRRGGASFVG